MLKKLTKPVHYFTYTLFHLPHSFDYPHKVLRLFTRYHDLFVVSLLPDIPHQIIDVAQGLRWADSDVLRFSMTIAAGAVAEDGFQWVAGRLRQLAPNDMSGQDQCPYLRLSEPGTG